MFIFDKNNNSLLYREEYKDEQDKVHKLRPGLYKVRIEGGGLFGPQQLFLEQSNIGDNLIEPSGDTYKELYSLCKEVFEPKTRQVYKDLNALNKTGLLLYGKQGTGKTSLALMLAKRVCQEYDLIGLICETQLPQRLIDVVRESDPGRGIILFIDEFDKKVDANNYNTADYRTNMLNFLDGAESRADVLTIACLNKYNKVPSEFKNRPSRFKIEKEISYCDSSMIKNYIETQLPKEYKDKLNLGEVIYKITEAKFTMDGLKTLLIDLFCTDKNIDELVKIYGKKEQVES